MTRPAATAIRMSRRFMRRFDRRDARSQPSDRADVLGFLALTAGGDVELDALTLVERAVAVADDGGEVHEHVGRALALDEAVALLGVEPLHGACGGCHFV